MSTKKYKKPSTKIKEVKISEEVKVGSLEIDGIEIPIVKELVPGIEIDISISGIIISVPLDLTSRINVSDLNKKIRKASGLVGSVVFHLITESLVRIMNPGIIEYVPSENKLVRTIAVKLSTRDIKALKRVIKMVLEKVS